MIRYLSKTIMVASVVGVWGLAGIASASIEVISAVYGTYQTAAPGFAGAKCYERDAINLTKKADDYCRAHNSEGICQYTVPWPSHQVDPGVGCFKSFSASYTCSGGGTDGDGRPDSYDILIGGNTSEAANQQVIFDCTPAKTGAKSTPLRSNGNVVSAGYSIAPDNVGRPDADGIIAIGAMVTRKSTATKNYDSEKYDLTCPTLGDLLPKDANGKPVKVSEQELKEILAQIPQIQVSPEGVGHIVVDYWVTGYSNVGKSTPVGGKTEVSSANVDFSMKVNEIECNGKFEYVGHRINNIEANFALTVNNFQVPLNIKFMQPASSTPVLKSTSTAQTLTKSRLISTAIAPAGYRTRPIGYELYYLNEFGVPASANVLCDFGTKKDVSYTTDSDGRLSIKGEYTVAEAGRDSDGRMTYSVTTTLTGKKPVFTLATGKEIGTVSCEVEDRPEAKFVDQLGIW